MLTQREIENITINLRVQRFPVVFTAAGTFSLTHGLNREPKRIVPVLQDAQADIWYTALTNTTILIHSDSAVNLTLEVS